MAILNDKYKRLTKNTLLFAIGTFAQKMFVFIFTPFYTRVLTTAEYGVSDLIITISSMAWPLLTILIDEAVLRFCFEKEVNKEQVISIGIYINILGIIAMMIVSPVILAFPSIREYYWYIIMYYIAFSVNYYFSYALRGIGEEKLFTLSGIINTVIAIILNILFLLVLKLGIKGYLIAFSLSYIITSIIQIRLSRLFKLIIPIKKIDRQLAVTMIKYSFPLIPNSVGWWINNSSDRIFVVSMCGSAANGIYSVAYKIPSIINVATGIFNNAFQISAFETDSERDRGLFFGKTFSIYYVFCLLASFGLVFFLRPLTQLLFANEFINAFVYCPILIYSSILLVWSSFYGTIYTTYKRTNMVFYSSVISAVVNIILNYCLICWFKSAMGAAVATLISSGVMLLLRIIHSRSFVSIPVNWTRFLLSNILLLSVVIFNTYSPDYILWINVFAIVLFFIIERNTISELITMTLNFLKHKKTDEVQN